MVFFTLFRPQETKLDGKGSPLESSSKFSNSLNMKTPSEHVLVQAHKIHELVTLSSIIPSSLQTCQKMKRHELTFLDSLKFNMEDKEEVFF